MPTGTASQGTLTKLLIEGYSKPDAASGLVGSVNAVINPETYSVSLNIDYEKSREIGKAATTQIFSGMGAGQFTLDLLVDGTGIVPIPGGLTVEAYIEKVKSVVYDYEGDTHRPNYLKITWGKNIFIGICKSITVNYTLFKQDGSPLRALIKLSLAQSVGFEKKVREAQQSSPDLTHMRTVLAGDTLPLMTYRIYGEAVHYMEVARVNGLNSIHAIKPGDELYFPPLK